MPLNIRSPFYGKPIGQVVPKAEQPAFKFFDRIGVMTENVVRSARPIAPTGAQSDAGLVLSVVMVQTIIRKHAAACPESRTPVAVISGTVTQFIRWKSVRTGEAFCVSATRNRTLNRLQPEEMNDASFTLWNVSQKAQSSGAPAAPLEAAGCGKEKAGMGYDTYPAFEPERNCSRPRSRAARRITEGEPK